MKLAINYEEKIGKTVGRRTVPRDAFAYGMALQKSGVEMAKAFGLRGTPRGVFRFRSHDEADAWLMKHLIRKPRN